MKHNKRQRLALWTGIGLMALSLLISSVADAARFYDPDLGRFMQRDTVDDGPSPYVYVSNNPLVMVDPTGHNGVRDPYTHTKTRHGVHRSLTTWRNAHKAWDTTSGNGQIMRFHNPLLKPSVTVWRWVMPLQ